MKPRFVILVAAIMTAALASQALAHNATPRIDARQGKQRVRIAQGVHRGELTRAEARRLRAGQRRIARVERRAKADCTVTRRERERIARAQSHENRAIRRLKHNARTR